MIGASKAIAVPFLLIFGASSDLPVLLDFTDRSTEGDDEGRSRKLSAMALSALSFLLSLSKNPLFPPGVIVADRYKASEDCPASWLGDGLVALPASAVLEFAAKFEADV